MSNLRLKDHTWDAANVYDSTLGKTQAQINSEGGAGQDGYSPVVTITDITGGHRVNITDKTHPQGQNFDVMNGTNGTNGTNGAKGDKGDKGDPGDPASAEDVTAAVTAWLAENITQESGYVIDDTLTVAGSAADAKKIGDEVFPLKPAVNLHDLILAEPLPFKIGALPYYVNANTGKSGSTSKPLYATSFVDVRNFEYLVYAKVCLTLANHAAGIAFYTEKRIDSFMSGNGKIGEKGALENGYETDIVKIPAGANYVCLTGLTEVRGFFVKGIKSNPLKGLNLSILGDSMSAYDGTIPAGNAAYYDGTNAGVKSADEMWWNVLCSNTGMSPLVIDAWSGSSVCYNARHGSSHTPMCSDLRTGRLAKDGVQPDIIIISGGTNDWTYSQSDTTPIGNWDGSTAIDRTLVTSGQSTFMESYASMIAKLRENYPAAIVVCCSLYFTCRGTALTGGVTRVNNIGHPVNDYNAAVKRVCEIMGVPFIDLYNIGFNNDNYYPTYAEDSSSMPTHANARGQAVIAKRLIEELPKVVKQFLPIEPVST